MYLVVQISITKRIIVVHNSLKIIAKIFGEAKYLSYIYIFITMLKAVQIKSTILQKLIEYGNSAVYPGLGKLVEYKGAYIRVVK